MPVFVAIAGNLGSGKTTLATVIARGFGWRYLPQARPELKYLNDLFSNPTRWSFESQVSFLASKADSIRRILGSGLSIVLDRSVYEDVSVFAQYFYQEGKLDERAYETYQQVAWHFLETLPSPDLLIYCACSPETSILRIEARELKRYERLYPPGHVHRLSGLYQSWISGFTACPAVSLNTEKFDLRDPACASDFLKDVESLLKEGTSEHPYQLSLFEGAEKPSEEASLNIFERVNSIPLQLKLSSSAPITLRETHPKQKTVYIAAPFTQRAQESPSSAQETKQRFLFEYTPPHGIITPGEYRKNLIRVARAFEELGFEPHLPHRDINKWGTKTLMPGEVVRLCRQSVAQADLFFGIFGTSLGVHFEAGVAAALGKPIIMAKVHQIENSFFAEGIATLPNSYVITAASIPEIPHLLFSQEIADFLQEQGLQ